jgi:translation initiation factor 2 subunit 1
MLLIRTGLPEEGEILLCEVSNIHFHSVFVKILEYQIDGMVHISEIAPGRIRNIRDYVKEGKFIICKVLRVSEEKKQVDLSLRRVNEREKTQKNNQIKQEQRAEKIIEKIAVFQKIKPEELYNKVAPLFLKNYPWLYNAFLDISEGKAKISDFILDKKLSELLEKSIKDDIKPSVSEIHGEFIIRTFASNGADIIKDAFSEVKKSVKGNYKIKYEGGGKYRVEIKEKDFTVCHATLDSMTSLLEKRFKNPESEFSFVKKDAKATNA